MDSGFILHLPKSPCAALSGPGAAQHPAPGRGLSQNMTGAPRGRAFLPVHAHFHHLWISQRGRWEMGGCQGLRESSLRADGPVPTPCPPLTQGDPQGCWVPGRCPGWGGSGRTEAPGGQTRASPRQTDPGRTRADNGDGPGSWPMPRNRGRLRWLSCDRGVSDRPPGPCPMGIMLFLSTCTYDQV